MRFTSIVVSAALTTVGLIQPAAAQLREVSVSYSDLDLSRAADAETLVDRLRHAARQACGGSPTADPSYRTAQFQIRRDFSRCVDEAMRSAVAGIDSPQDQRAYAATVQRDLS